MEIAIIVFSMILLNTFLYYAIVDYFVIEEVFQGVLIWFFSVPIFVFMFVAICGRLFGRGLLKLEKIGRK